MMIIQKLRNKFWLKIAGAVVLTAVVLAVVFWPAGDSRKAEPQISEKEKRAKAIQAYRDKKRRLPVKAEPLTEKQSSKLESEETANSFSVKDGEKINLAEVLAAKLEARKAAVDNEPDAVLSDPEIRKFIEEKMGEDVFAARSNYEQAEGVSQRQADYSAERSSELSQTQQASRSSMYLDNWEKNRQSKQSEKSGLILGGSQRAANTSARSSDNNEQYIMISPTDPVEIELPETAVGEVNALYVGENMKNIRAIDPNRIKLHESK